MNRLGMYHLYPFKKKTKTKKKTRAPPPPHAKGKKISRIMEIGDLKAKNTHNFGGINRHELGKNGLRMYHLHPFFKNFLGETPTPPPILREDKKFPLVGFIWSSTGKVKILPHHIYRRSELWRQKLHTIFWGKIDTNSAKKWAQDAPFASIFQKFSRGRPPNPHLREGVSPSRTLPLRRFAPNMLRPPWQWTLRIRHCNCPV